jgi:hypothetical protein
MKNYCLPLSKSIPFCNEKFYELLAEAKALGFDAIDFDIASAWNTPELEEEYFLHLEEGMAAVIESGLPVNCIHIPFGDRWNPCLLDETARRAVVEKFRAILARTASLKPLGYIGGTVTPVDMFPGTGHVESVVCLERRLDVDMRR